MPQITGQTQLPGTGPLRGTWYVNIGSHNGLDVVGDGTIVRLGEQPIARDEGTGSTATLPNGVYNFTFYTEDDGAQRQHRYGPYKFELTADAVWGDVVEAPIYSPVTPTDVAQALEHRMAAAGSAATAESWADDAAASAAAAAAPADGAISALVASSASATSAAIKQRYVTEGAAFADISKYAGVDPTGVTECGASIQTALNDIKSKGQRAYAQGTFKIASTVAITSNADLGDATFNYTGTGSGVAVQIGDGTTLHRLNIILPAIMDATKTGTGWAPSRVGLRIVNLNSSIVTVPRVTGFETGMLVYGQAQGTSYCTFTIGHLDNNKRNQVLSADSTGWSNQNLYLGGRFSHNSSEGTNVAGTRHILLETTPNLVNNNTWVNVSIEANIVEQQIDVDGGVYNMWINPRLERSAGIRVRWGASATSNSILGGYAARLAVVTRVSGESLNAIQAPGLSEFYGTNSTNAGVVRVVNRSSAGASAITVYEGVDLSEPSWAWAHSSNQISGKRPGDTQPRVVVDAFNGRVLFGDGTDTPRAGGTTAQRPSPVLGRLYVDTTLGKPIWGFGTTWRDANGTPV